MKKILASSLIITLGYSFFIPPCFAILEKKPDKNIQQEITLLDNVNYDWWKKNSDAYLESYISKALENNHDIKTAVLKIQQAKLNVSFQNADMLPVASVGFSPTEVKLPQTTKGLGIFAIPIIASWELDLFGKNWDKVKSAKKMLNSSEFQAQGAEIAIVSYVGTVYYNIIKLDKIISLQEKLVQNRKDIYELMSLSNKEGIVSTSDLILSEKNYVLSQNDLLEFKKQREQALNALAVLIGDSPNNVSEYKRASIDELNLKFDIPNEIPSEIIVNRPDYKALEKQLEAKGIDIRVAKKEFLPTINILGLLAFAALSSGPASSMGWKNAASIIGGSADLPLFTGFKRVTNLKLNKNMYQQLLERYQKTNLVAIQEVNDSLYNLKADKQKLDNNIKAYDIQKKDYEYSLSKYKQGVISKLDLLQHQEALIFIEQLNVSAKADCYIDRIGLYKTTGAKV